MSGSIGTPRNKGRQGHSVIALALVGLLLTGCGRIERQGPQATAPTSAAALPTQSAAMTVPVTGQQTWTVLIYLDADNNLEQAALADMAEMQAAGSPPPGVAVLVQVDRIPRYTPLDGNWTGTRRYQVTGDDPLLLGDLGEVNMGAPASLADFVAWGAAYYPAQHTALILWNHGAGWPGLAWDESSPGEDNLTLTELAAALATTGRLDIVGFDACLMGQLDVLQAVAPYADLAVASEEIEPAAGWDYRAWLAQLYAQPGIAPRDLAAAMVGGYHAFYTTTAPEPATTLAAVDLARWGEVRTAVDELAGAMQADLAATLPAIGDSRAAVETYATAYSEEVEQYAAVDLAHFARLLAEQSPDPALAESARRLDAAIQAAVLAEAHGSAFSQAGGVAVYFPRSSATLNTSYAEASQVPAWSDFLAAYIPAAEAAFNAPQVGVESVETGTQRRPFLLQTYFEGEQIFQVYAVGGQVRDDGSLRLLKLDPVKRDQERDRRQREVRWLPLLAVVSDGTSGEAVVPWPTSAGSNVVSVLGRYRPAGDDASYEAQLLFDRESGQLLRVWGSVNYGGEQRPFEIAPVPGDQVQLYDFTLSEGGAWTAEPGAVLTVPAQGYLALTWEPAPAGRYFLGLLGEDVAGHRALATVEVELGRLRD